MNRISLIVRLNDGHRYQSCPKQVTDDELKDMYEFLGHVSSGRATYLALDTERGKVYIPGELLKTAVIEVIVEPV